MKIALDVDGVLADVIQSWLNYSNFIRQKIQKHEITDWNFWKKFEINRYDFYSELSSCWKNWTSIPPTEKNLALVTKNLSDIAQVDIVTARERSTDSFVKKWLEHYNISYDNYVSVIDGPMKADLDYDVFIDDSPLNAFKFLKNKKNVILYSQPWNQHIVEKNIHRISNLSEAIIKLN
ncbi:Putative nucleotidase YqfW protein [Marine Group I thaumarchaeote SCGC AAA799-N04]|uniref:Putative nucleotidase YqfW protein n=1 Tax=Marine Group I thaumarchaeote SCGC AAA799-N04 TaxID=1502293 RepID=A0A081RQF6_9ARCH|nr:Putative nucleotidase YqfW protein [Marine Group I thaumarchaeote SCGC AAA799-N04]